MVLADGFDLTAFLNKYSIERMVDLVETTTMATTGAVYVSRIGGTKDGKVSLAGFWDGTATTGIDVRADAQLNGASFYQTIVHGGNTYGNRAGVMTVKEGNYKTEASVSDAVSFSLDEEIDGAISGGWLLHALGAETGAGNDSTSKDLGASGYTGFRANLHVTAFSGTSITPKLQDSANNSVWADLTGGAFSAASAVGAQQISSSTQAVRQYVRTAWTGTISSVTFAVAIAQY